MPVSSNKAYSLHSPAEKEFLSKYHGDTGYHAREITRGADSTCIYGRSVQYFSVQKKVESDIFGPTKAENMAMIIFGH